MINKFSAWTRQVKFWRWLFGGGALLILVTILGGSLGYWAGRQARLSWKIENANQAVTDQFDLGVQDLEAGRYEVARQRFEYVIVQEPDYPGALDRMSQVLQVLYATASPAAVTPTVTPTRDLRPVEELFSQARLVLAAGDWNSVIDVLTNLRKQDSAFQAARVDGMLYISLRNRGVDKITKESNLEGGIYDLALAEHFGPLDMAASGWRNWARLYMIGSSFWEADPEQAVYYFSQVAAGAPGLRDASGWTATDRYRAAIIQYGDKLGGNGDWCAAQTQYELAQSIRDEAALQATIDAAVQKCSPPTETPVPATITPTLSLTDTSTVIPLLSATPTSPELSTPLATTPATVTPLLPTETFTPLPIPELTPSPPPLQTPTTPPVIPTATLPAPVEPTATAGEPPTPTPLPPPPDAIATQALAN